MEHQRCQSGARCIEANQRVASQYSIVIVFIALDVKGSISLTSYYEENEDLLRC